MKKLLIATNVLFIIIICFQSCVSGITKGSISYYACSQQETYGQTFSHFKSVVNNYRTERWDIINQLKFNSGTVNMAYASLVTKYNSTDARCIWFPLDTIKKFICTIEKYNSKLKSPAKNLGIRFYYAVYGDDQADVNKKWRHTIFMAPTYQEGNGQQVDFDPRETFYKQDNMKGMFKLIDFAGNPNAICLILGERSSTSSADMFQNNGEMCPANCPDINNNTFKVIDP